MSSRRDFLRKTTIALAGSLIVGDQAIELFERLTHVRKSFPSAEIYRWPHGLIDMVSSSSVHSLHTTTMLNWSVAPARDYWLQTTPRFAESYVERE